MRQSRLNILINIIMAKHWHMVYLWSVWHLQTYNVAAFNLDTQNVLQRNGDPGSLFGFSVAFHQQLNPIRKNMWVKLSYLSLSYFKSNSVSVSYHIKVFPPRLLVGAPRSKHRNQVNVTGVVYQCDLATTSERCQPIEFDNEGLFACFTWLYESSLHVYWDVISSRK